MFECLFFCCSYVILLAVHTRKARFSFGFGLFFRLVEKVEKFNKKLIL